MARDKSEIFDELSAALKKGLASGTLLTREQIATNVQVFRERFGPDVLKGLDGQALLRTMHGRADAEARCLAYWLEFKNDDEFAGNRFGGIGGGSALKFGLFQRKEDAAWITGSARDQRVISEAEATEIARKQRDELLAGHEVLVAFSPNGVSDAAYSRLQAAMEEAAPQLSNSAWAHKYWFLLHNDRLDDYHSPRWQRFHLLKLLQLPPDGEGIMNGSAPRFVCAGRFIDTARKLDVPVTTLTSVLTHRDGSLHGYWRVGTTEGDSGESYWQTMLDGGFVSIGWAEIGDLTPLLTQDSAKEKIRGLLGDHYDNYYAKNPGVATRKAGEIYNFAAIMAENDIVLACDGLTVRGVGRVKGPYEFDGKLKFAHKRPVQWTLVEPWTMPEKEGLQTTVFELGRKAKNLLELEQRLFEKGSSSGTQVPTGSQASPAVSPLPELDPFTARVDAILRRKSQVIFYGPPGTGKTYLALAVANELASRRAFSKRFADLTDTEKRAVTGPGGLVRVCTFHPGYGYEDFIEGLRPDVEKGQMAFKPRNGIFKELCEAAKDSTRHFFLVIDEINRGDVPRIFGELLTVIETDKRGSPVLLPLKPTSFYVPPNVFLIGTMNTADRSISLLDAALRRRFGFVELMPDSSLLRGRVAGGIRLGSWLDALNTRLRKNLKRDARNLQIGHAYLMPSQPITSISDFARVLRDDVIPLLEEYCYDDFGTLAVILGSALVDTEAGRIREELFEPNREQDLVQALSFEEMQPLILDQKPIDEAVEAEGDDNGQDGQT